MEVSVAMAFNPSDPLHRLVFIVLFNAFATACAIIIALEISKKKTPLGTAGYVLLPLGIITLLSSILFDSTTLAFIGLGLTFWGALLLYVKADDYIKAGLLDPTAISSIISLDEMISKLGVKGKAVYLPPRNIRELKGGRIFISKTKNEEETLKTIEADYKNRQKNQIGIYLTPPGVELANLYEEKIGKGFASIEPEKIKENLLKVFIEDLEMAENLEIDLLKKRVKVKIEGSPYAKLCRETRRLKNITNSIGCPLCSSLAIAIARSTGKPVIIEREEPSESEAEIEVTYRILEA